MVKHGCFLFVGFLQLASCDAPATQILPEKRISTQIVTTTAQDGWAVNYPKQRKLFFFLERFWLFYSDGKDAVYCTSSDGKQWSNPTLVKQGGHFGHRTGYWFDGTYIHYAHNAAAAGETVVYRRGKPAQDGTIDWSTPEQQVFSVSATANVMYPKVIVDPQGFPWVSFVLCKGSPHNAPYDAIVVRSSTTDGTWKTAIGFPYTLVRDHPDAYPDAVGTPMTKGQTYWIFNKKQNDVYHGRMWDGSDWKDEEQATLSRSSYSLYNILAEGDDVHLIYGGGTVRYRKRTVDKGWGDEQTITYQGNGHASLTLAGPNQIIATWLNTSNHRIYFRKLQQGQWGNPIEIADESKDIFAGSKSTLGINHNSLLASTPSIELAIVYTTGQIAPYALKFVAVRR